MELIIVVKIEGKLNEKEVKTLKENEIALSSSKSIFGGNEVVELICVLSPVIIVAISKIIIEKIKRKQIVSVKINHVEINNITEKNALQILKEQLNSSKNQSQIENLDKSDSS